MVWYINSVVKCVLKLVKLLILVVLVAVLMGVSVQSDKCFLREDVLMLMIVHVSCVC